MSRSSHVPWFDYHYNKFLSSPIMKLLIQKRTNPKAPHHEEHQS
jgi:hypothetical protein